MNKSFLLLFFKKEDLSLSFLPVVIRYFLRQISLMPSLEIPLPDQAATEHLAAKIADLMLSGDVVLLAGELGAGKSTFARALLRHLASDPALEVPSPTFTLQQSYHNRLGSVHHFDLWRLGDVAELDELGWEEALRDVILVEWPERLGSRAPENALTIAFSITGEHTRAAVLTGWPDRLAALR
jgi:tRNA threonylcarbamoyladenosine biosynthesis protein TsaE